MSYLKALKITKKEDKVRGYSFREANDKIELIESVKTNMIEAGGVQRNMPFSTDNYKVTVNPEKQQMKI